MNEPRKSNVWLTFWTVGGVIVRIVLDRDGLLRTRRMPGAGKRNAEFIPDRFLNSAPKALVDEMAQYILVPACRVTTSGHMLLPPDLTGDPDHRRIACFATMKGKK